MTVLIFSLVTAVYGGAIRFAARLSQAGHRRATEGFRQKYERISRRQAPRCARVVEVALSLMLLAGAGLLMRSFVAHSLWIST
jgi:hypothetical protein